MSRPMARGHHKRRKQDRADSRRPVTWCIPCGRSTFLDRKSAKAHGKHVAPSKRHVAYECPVKPGYYHHDERSQ